MRADRLKLARFLARIPFSVHDKAQLYSRNARLEAPCQRGTTPIATEWWGGVASFSPRQTLPPALCQVPVCCCMDREREKGDVREESLHREESAKWTREGN